jgi:Ser-tRNA(Ala) deacylase AlaX
MILGKTPNYDVSGKLKNSVVTPKIVGEKELSDLLTDDAYKALGCCEILCVDCYDSGDVKVKFTDRMDEVNKSIKAVNQKAKTKVQLLEEENQKLKVSNASIMERLEALEDGKGGSEETETLKDKIKRMERENLDNEGLYGTHVKPIHSDGDIRRAKLEAKAKELDIKFGTRLGDVKLLERINEKDKEFKL